MLRILRHAILSILVCALLSTLSISASTPVITPANIDTSSPAAIDIFDVIPDPELDTQPDAYVNGTSTEFEYEYHPNLMQLTWTHTPGTMLNFHSEDDSAFPQFNDFVYFSQSFSWPYEEKPSDAQMELNYSIALSGSFLSELEGGLMFKVYAWLIDSSNNWELIYLSYPPYSMEYHERKMDLNYFDILAGWGGMIPSPYTEGQEDPQDVLTLGIGLVPTDEFLNYSGSEPWQIYSGSVLVNITSMDLFVVMESEPDPASYLEPLYNKTYGAVLGDVYDGLALDRTYELQDRLFDMETDSSGDVYLTGETNTGYDFFSESGFYQSHQFLIKYSPTLNREWIVRNNNMSRGRDITFHDGNVFTTGCYFYRSSNYRDVMVTKWTASGQKIWERVWGGPNDQVGIAIGVHDDGSIYVMVSDYNYRGPTESDDYQNTTLVKLDSTGSMVWNKSIQLSTIQDVPGKLWIFKSHMIYWIDSLLMSLDLDGNILWQKPSWSATVDENGVIYSTSYASQELGISRIAPDGNETWKTSFEVQYPNGWYEIIQPCDMSLTKTNELLVLVRGYNYDRSFFLLKYDLNGTLLQKWTIGNEAWPIPGSSSVLMNSASTGLVYFSFNLGWDVWCQGYSIGEYTIPTQSVQTFTQIGIIGGIAAVIIVVSYFVRKKIQR